ncbi:hypothetical protein B0H13DRAFT_2289755 [Mycena leptocephala]|nr:hypothetical protein B0H13DRAFT_2289755 [Mycena leptocephala]
MSTGICRKCGFLEDELHVAATVPHGTAQWRDLQRTRLKHTKASICALEAHIDTLQARLDALDSERCQLEETLDSVVYPIISIPVETVSRIFLNCLPANGRVRPSIFSAPVSLAQISRHWRRIAVSIPHLWRSIDLELGDLISCGEDFGDGSPSAHVCSLLKTWFRRTNGHPLSITLRCDADFDLMPPNILSTIAEFSEQWGRLEVVIPREDVAALGCILGPFPQLHSFALEFTEPHGEPPPLDCLVAYQEAPQLRELRGLRLADLRPASATLISLELPLHERLSLAEWVGLLDRFPALLHLSAAHDYGSNLPLSTQASAKNPPLESLDIRLGSPLPVLTLPHLCRLRYPLDSSPSRISDFLSFITRSTCPLQSLTLYIPLWDEDTYLDCLRAVPSLVKLDVRPWGQHHNFYQHMESPTLLPQLTDLVVGEDGYEYDYVPLLRMLHARRTMQPSCALLRSFSLALDVSGSDPDHDISPPPDPIAYQLRRLVDGGLRFLVYSRAQGNLGPTDFCGYNIQNSMMTSFLTIKFKLNEQNLSKMRWTSLAFTGVHQLQVAPRTVPEDYDHVLFHTSFRLE